MNNRQTRVTGTLETMLRADAVKRAAPDSEIGAIAESLRAKVHEIGAIRVTQGANRHAGWLGAVRRRLDALRAGEMLVLARLARRVFAGDSAMEEALAVPHKRAPTEEILSSADRMVKALRPHVALLRESRIDPARLDRIAAGAAEIRNELPAATAMTADRAVPTRRLAELLRSARRDADALAILVVPELETPGSKLAWKSVLRIPKKTGRPRAKKAHRPKAAADDTGERQASA